MAAIKSVFEKSYMTANQAATAAHKALGLDADQEYRVEKRDADGRWVVIAPVATIEAPAVTPEFIAQAGQGIADDLLLEALAYKPMISTCEKPTKKVWHIADTMPKASRKEVMAQCMAQGIAYGTARTQYQAWFKASQECMRGDIRKPYTKGE